MANAFEFNFDGLVGPTHNYAGLSHGNVASTTNKALVSNPLEAVLQGLLKMKTLSDLGLKQAVLPPQERPDLKTLRKLGFSGNDLDVLKTAATQAPEILSAVSSASSMWTANAATVSPSADTQDGKVHFTPANLVSKFHRSIEPSTTSRILRAIFKDPQFFSHHDPLPASPQFGDEGAANHTRLCSEYSSKGLEFFVFGRQGITSQGLEPKKFPARQTWEASSAVSRLHRLDPEAVIFAQQSPEAIDAGVFHNDVAGVGNEDVYFYHELSFADRSSTERNLKTKFKKICGKDLKLICAPASQISLEDAVKSYLFNSQLISLPSGGMMLVLPQECEASKKVARYVEELKSMQDSPFREIRFLDLRQSMRNGGGPACLRLRVVLTEKEISGIKSPIFMTDSLYALLVSWAKKHYRDRLSFDDLRDISLLKECQGALDELTQLLNLGSIYPFQLG